jgi:ankyrin repeat protein
MEKARRLLDSGILHSPRGLFGSTPLLQAAENGQRETIRLLLEHNASISEQDEYQRTVLHFASAGGYAEAADELLLHGADISPINTKGQTFLYLVVLNRSTEIVAVFLDKRAMVLRNRCQSKAISQDLALAYLANSLRLSFEYVT